jgi:hypothetical protein
VRGLGEAKHAARNVAKFRSVCRKRVAGTTFSGKSSERRNSSLPAAGSNRSNRPSLGHAGEMGATPIQAQPLAENLTLLSGPGGNVVVLNGPDGKVVADTFLLPAWPKLKEALDGLGNAPLKTVIDTHWHFDHTDNNANLHAAGATVLAHENTKTRMAEPHDRPRMLYLNRHSAPAKNFRPMAK